MGSEYLIIQKIRKNDENVLKSVTFYAIIKK